MLSKKDIYVLGIHDGHVAGATLLKNGRVMAAINEERLTMVKNQAGIPILSIQKVLDIACVDPQDITCVAIASKLRIVSNPDVQYKNIFFQAHNAIAPFFHSKAYIKFAVELVSRVKPRTGLSEALTMVGITKAPVVFINHHRAHTASAYYRRPWKDKTLIFTLDGMGDGISATVSVGQGNTITRIAETSFYDSPSDNLYSEVTEYLGMRRAEHEYKIMGLAPYGDYKKTANVFRDIIRLNPDNNLEFQNQTRFYLSSMQKLFRTTLAKKRFDHVAAGVQKVFEELVSAWVVAAVKQTHIHKITAAGGSFLNVKSNMLLRKLPEVSDMFIYPACDDCGIAEGAALAGYVDYCQSRQMSFSIAPLDAIYYGGEFTSEQIEEFLRQKKLLKHAQKVDNSSIAKMLSQGNIIARFAGRDEWGPRALGNRSIMADPRHLALVGRINRAIKQRDFWMPFAPAILQEDQARYVKDNHFAPYMIEAFDTKEESVHDIIATIHPADRTTRPMTVNSWNPSWQQILREFKKLTGVGAILNTSFNLHGYPLVGTPEHAVWTYQHSDLDGLILGDWLLTKKK